ncbi:MAG: PorP/SprF family type IX secretion system membrane protein [Saprospiraceae bacterium]|nr:PorP/SprF family type IX secretion system membrane protein [Saprospiraceae bacterium]
MTKSILFFFIMLLVILLPMFGQAQQRPLFTQHFYNKYYDNPAYGGMKRSLQFDLAYRDQYTTLSGQPSTLYLGFHLPLYKYSGGGGFQMVRHEAGLLQHTQAAFSYNYVTGLLKGLFSLGGRMGIQHTGVSGDKIVTPEGSYEGTINHNDPLLSTERFYGTGVVWELGAYYLSQKWEAGLMVYDFPQHTMPLGLTHFEKTSGMVGTATYSVRYNRFILMPNLVFRTDFKEFQSDIGVNVSGLDNLFGGISFRGYNKLSVDALAIIIGTNIGRHYSASYSYDLGLSDLRHVYDGTHEIMLRYNLNKAIGLGVTPKIIRNSRHL